MTDYQLQLNGNTLITWKESEETKLGLLIDEKKKKPMQDSDIFFKS